MAELSGAGAEFASTKAACSAEAPAGTCDVDGDSDETTSLTADRTTLPTISPLMLSRIPFSSRSKKISPSLGRSTWGRVDGGGVPAAAAELEFAEASLACDVEVLEAAPEDSVAEFAVFLAAAEVAADTGVDSPSPGLEL